MYSEFIKEFKIEDKTEEEKDIELIDTIKYVKKSLGNMYNNLQYADSDLIDYYTYQIKAEEAKYNYLIKQAKKKKLNIAF
ncbi:MAG: YaaL family protein [Clostridia bacterium]|nr:YaaL family protein [Clostridia bacterium]